MSLRAAAWIGLLLLASAARAGDIAGTVRSVEDGRALWGAHLTLSPGGRSTVSDETGAFAFAGVPAGRLRLRVEMAGFEPLEQEVRAGQTLELWLVASERGLEEEEIVVRSRREERQAAGRAEVSTVLVSREDILQSAGTLQDPVRVVASLPGVVGLSEITPLFFVRGGAAHESFFYLDDAIIYNPFQLGGGATIFNPALIEDVKFYAGGHGVEYPGSLSGVLDIRYRDPRADKLHGDADLSLISTNLTLEGPTFAKGPSFLLSFRRSNFEIPLAVAQALDLVSDRFAAPAFWDLYARLRQDLGRGHSLRLSALYVRDGLDLIEFTPEDVEGMGAGTFFYRNETLALIARYRGEIRRDVLHTAVFSMVNNDLQAAATGLNPLAVNSRVESFTLRSDWLVRLRGDDALMFGAFANRTRATLLADGPDIRRFIAGVRFGGYRNIPNLEFDLGFPFFMAGVYFKHSASFFSERLVIEPGLRLSFEEPAQEWMIEPRANARLRLRSNLEARLAVGLFLQPVLNPVMADPDFGNPRLGSERALHFIGGLEWTFVRGWLLRGELFAKRYFHMPANTDDAAGFLSGYVEPYTSEGSGFAWGGELFLEKRGSVLSGWLSLGYLSVSRRNPRLTGEFAEAANLDPGTNVPFSAALVVYYRPHPRLELSLRLLAHSGNPYTPLDPEEPFRLELDANTQQPVWEARPDMSRLNGLRAPFYFKTDLRAAWTFELLRFRLQLYLELMNAQFRRNVVVYSATRGRPPEQEPRFGPIFELPIIPFVGLRGWF